MDKAALFGEVLEAAEGLPLEDQENLAEILHRRVVERRREELVWRCARRGNNTRKVAATLSRLTTCYRRSWRET